MKRRENDMIHVLHRVPKKLAIPGNDPINISEERFNAIRKQLDAQLNKPVLRTSEFAEFDLESSFRVVFEVAVKLGETSLSHFVGNAVSKTV